MRPPSADAQTYVPADERLFCAVCSKEVRVVRLGRSLLVLGHLQNPRHKHHLVRLARSGADATGQAPIPVGVGPFVDSQRRSGAPDHRRGDEASQPRKHRPSPDPESLRAHSTRPALRGAVVAGRSPASLTPAPRSAARAQSDVSG